MDDVLSPSPFQGQNPYSRMTGGALSPEIDPHIDLARRARAMEVELAQWRGLADGMLVHWLSVAPLADANIERAVRDAGLPMEKWWEGSTAGPWPPHGDKA